MKNLIQSISQINTECPVVVDISDVFEGIMRPRHWTTWKEVRDAVNLLQKVCYLKYNM